MGRQVRFHSHADDVVALERFLADSGAVVVERRAPTTTPVPTTLLEASVPEQVIVRALDIPTLRWDPRVLQVTRGIDTTSSPVVTYSPGHTRDGRPRFVSPHGPGRMGFATSAWIGDAHQVRRWREDHDPEQELPPDAVRVVITRATRSRPRHLVISVRTDVHLPR